MVLELLDFWFEKEVIDIEDKQRICHEITDQDKARKALEIIAARGGKAVLVFMQSLKGNWQHICDIITATEVDISGYQYAGAASSSIGKVYTAVRRGSDNT